MIKIQPINNANISFNGTFIKNIALDKTLKQAEIPELINFKEHLIAMSRSCDNRVFSLSTYVKKSSLGKTQVLRLSDSTPQFNSSYTVGSELDVKDSIFADFCYNGALKKINDIIDRYYPIQNKVESRPVLMKIIESYLEQQ